MDLSNIKILAKANNTMNLFFPPDKSGGNSMNRNAALAHSINNDSSIGMGLNPFAK
jgi:hypothetical protein